MSDRRCDDAVWADIATASCPVVCHLLSVVREGRRAQDACRKGWLRASPTGPVSTAAVLAVAADIARAMVALHGAGIVHGDLSGGVLPR